MSGRVLIVGIDSMIGGAVARNLAEHGYEIVATSRRRANPSHLYLELTDAINQWPIPPNIDFACIFTGVTALRDCESDPAGSRLVNVTATLTLIDRLIARDIYVMYPSSNLVFNGVGSRLDETEKQSPITEYGRQKADVERGMSAYLDRASIVRFTKVLPPRYELFANWQRDLGAGQRIRPFKDLLFAPITLAFTADVIRAVCSGRHTGIFHASGRESISYADVALHIARRIGADEKLIKPISGKESALNMDLMPRNATLAASRLQIEFGFGRCDVWKSIDSTIGLISAPQPIGAENEYRPDDGSTGEAQTGS
jgi:dTDP-4-dehydrorhamnose reductase